ncbi:MAG: amidohydrolase [Candidatus Cloacimonetes bacterium]|nr:amidohydrolase [Candidatus Cloacimonadota bacterium]
MKSLQQLRRELHQIPELAHEEYLTQAYLLEQMREYTELEIYEFSPTGILAAYTGGKGSYQLFRADMDALALSEQTGCGFESQHEGVMHACGHDMHMTILLGLIAKVMAEQPAQNVLFLFQPAEEGKGGAARVLADGIWDKYKVGAAYALHVSPDLPVGEISSRAGNFFAATCEFDLRIIGKSAHIATPSAGRNALQAGIEIYQCVQQLPRVVKSGEHFICDFGILQSGNVRNAIPSECFMSGTIRAEDQERIAALKASLEGICESVELAYEVQVQVEYLVEYKEVYNKRELVDDLKQSAQEAGISFREAELTLAGEDFGFIAGRWGGVLFWLGAAGEEFYPLHNNRFLPDEKALETGVRLLWRLLKKRKGT